MYQATRIDPSSVSHPLFQGPTWLLNIVNVQLAAPLCPMLFPDVKADKEVTKLLKFVQILVLKVGVLSSLT